MIVEHGGNIRDFSLSRGLNPDDALDLSASLHPCAPQITNVLLDRLRSVRNYPDSRDATGFLADAIGVDPERLLLTNGGSEAIALVADVLVEGNVVAPEFSLYQRHLKRVVKTAPRWRSNPNNPLGTLAEPSEQAAVWDEAFYPIATGQFTRGDEQSWRIGSMTKIWACAGLRLGYVVTPDVQSCRVLASRQPRWSVNGLALAIVEPMLEKTNLRAMKDQLEVLRTSLFLLLQEKGIAVHMTDANWLLVHNGARLYEHLATKNIFIRNCASFGLENTYRIAVPAKPFIEELKNALIDFEVEHE